MINRWLWQLPIARVHDIAIIVVAFLLITAGGAFAAAHLGGTPLSDAATARPHPTSSTAACKTVEQPLVPTPSCPSNMRNSGPP
jgi:hypothetical protein